MTDFSRIPVRATLQPILFEAHVSDAVLFDFKQLLRLSKIGPQTYENLQEDRRFGVTHEWLTQAKKHWETIYDWRACEAHINSFPNFKAGIKDDDGEDFEIHFAALFSTREDAVPLMLLHGWPGSFLEFLDFLAIMKKRFPSSNDLPYHLIVPSLPGYGYSSGPPLHRNWETEDTARVLNKLMVGLGFGDGYVAQGGDIGSFVARIMAARFDACKAIHLNFVIMAPPKDVASDAISDAENKGLLRAQEFGTTGNAYTREHGTRPATIGLALSSSPIALLAWVGEKYQQWTDVDPTLDQILDSVTLYWFTSSFSRSIYPYREMSGHPAVAKDIHGDPKNFCRKPMGHSWFPLELAPIPHAYVERTGNLVWRKSHSDGGHFAAIEKPNVLADDVEEFVKEVWGGRSSLKAAL